MRKKNEQVLHWKRKEKKKCFFPKHSLVRNKPPRCESVSSFLISTCLQVWIYQSFEMLAPLFPPPLIRNAVASANRYDDDDDGTFLSFV